MFCRLSRKLGASSHFTEKAKVVSCDIGEKGFEVGGKASTDRLLGTGTASTRGAV
jgi:hypothetical protein